VIDIGVGIMTVPSRKDLTTALCSRLRGEHLRYYVSEDVERRGTWFNWQRTAKMVAKWGHSHIVVLQDDAQLLPFFGAHLHRVVALLPDAPLSLYTSRKSTVDAARRVRRHLYAKRGMDSGVATVFPAAVLRDFFDWSASLSADLVQKYRNNDDVYIDEWCRSAKVQFTQVVPTLVDHRIDVPSTLGHNPVTRGSPMTSKWRITERDENLDWSTWTPDAGELK
jgi:hypothetical protein